jgi:hypothetical protein
MNKEDSRPRAWFSRSGPKDLDLFAAILVVLQECSLDNPATFVSQSIRRDSTTADKHNQVQKKYTLSLQTHLQKLQENRSRASNHECTGHFLAV